MRTTALRPAVLACALAGLAAPAMAGGPLVNCHSSQPFLWPGGGVNIPWNPDRGGLGPLTHAQAVAAVGAAFGTWAAVPTASVRYLNAGELPVDVDVTNFEPYLIPDAPDGLSAIVFDHTGEIFDLLFGPGSGILGFAGPEWLDASTCRIVEGVAFLNGPAFADGTAARDVMVHEFGHYTGLAHTVVNGQIYLSSIGDTSGPTPFDTFGSPGPIANDLVETMYPFYFGPGSGTQTLETDDVSILSTLYPAAGFFAGSASITGRILAPNGTTPLTGVNVIARNVADPFADAVSAVSGDFAASASPSDPFAGVYRLHGLTPGAQYAVYVDQILEGGFSTPAIALPGPEEFYNAGESNNLSAPDDPSVFTPVSAAAGGTASGVNVVFNGFKPGQPLPVGDEGFVQLFPPFPFKVCGQEFDSVFVNANGHLTFGTAAPFPDFLITANAFLDGPPRIAPLWTDLDPSAGGEVTFDQTSNEFTVRWDAVPEFDIGGSNTFQVTLERSANQATFEYDGLTATGGLAGLSCGGGLTSGFENERHLRSRQGHDQGGHDFQDIGMNKQTAVFETFTAGDNDLEGARIRFVSFKRGFQDAFEPNNSIARATPVRLPFDSSSLERFTAIDPVGGDVDFFRFSVKAGDHLALEVVRGTFDSTLGVFDADTGALLARNDDGGGGVLSRLLLTATRDLNLAVAVSAYPDFAFDGSGKEGGRYVLYLRRYRGTLLPAGDDTATSVPLGRPFSFQGQSWNSVFVNSNGNLTFGTGSTDFGESVFDLVMGPPRIAPLWDDFDARFGLVIADTGPFSTSIHYVSVPEFLSDSPNYFSVHLLPFGITRIEYGPTARSDSLVGITQGSGVADPGETDLSARPFFGNRGTVYERFHFTDVGVLEPFDLSFRDLFFAPLP